MEGKKTELEGGGSLRGGLGRAERMGDRGEAGQVERCVSECNRSADQKKLNKMTGQKNNEEITPLLLSQLSGMSWRNPPVGIGSLEILHWIDGTI